MHPRRIELVPPNVHHRTIQVIENTQKRMAPTTPAEAGGTDNPAEAINASFIADNMLSETITYRSRSGVLELRGHGSNIVVAGGNDNIDYA